MQSRFCHQSGLHGKFESETIIANAIFLRHFHIVKDEGMGIRSTDAEFIFLRPTTKPSILLHTIRQLMPLWPSSGWSVP